MAPLDRAVALAEVDAVAVGVEQDLDLDVAPALDEALEDQPVVAERGAPRVARPRARPRGDRGSRTVRIPLPPPPAAGLTRSG